MPTVFGKGLAEIFSASIREIEDSINLSNSFHEWRASEDDINPLHSKRWKEIKSNFTIDLESDTPIVDQIMEYQEIWERRIRLGYQKTKDRKILEEIKRSPLPPCISVDGSNRDEEGKP